jgi:hypothetical protein
LTSSKRKGIIQQSCISFACSSHFNDLDNVEKLSRFKLHNGIVSFKEFAIFYSTIQSTIQFKSFVRCEVVTTLSSSLFTCNSIARKRRFDKLVDSLPPPKKKIDSFKLISIKRYLSI